MNQEVEGAKAMYPKAKYLWRTSDAVIHTTAEGAEAQASHLADPKIQKIKCKNSSKTGSEKASPD